MTARIHARAGLTTALAVAAALAATAPAQSLPTDLRTPDARDAGKQGISHSATESALAQESYYSSFRPSLSPQTGADLRSIDARDAANVPDGAVTRVEAPVTPEPAGSGGFEWDDAAIGAGGALGLMLVLAGGAAAISRRHRPVTP